MISEICPTEAEEEPASGLPHFVDEDSIQSEVEDKEQSMFGKRKFIMYFMIFYTAVGKCKFLASLKVS